MQSGAENLLVACGGLGRGDTLLILCEDAGLGYYDGEISKVVAECARTLGIETTIAPVPFEPMGGNPTPELLEDMKAVDRVLFLARFGDQMRFSPSMAGIRPIMSYALSAGALNSDFGRADYGGFVRLKDAVNTFLGAARDIRVTCPLGTDFSGSVATVKDTPEDVTVDRFPMLIFAPVPAEGFAGSLVQEGFLVGTGSKYYAPFGCALDGPVTVYFDGTGLIGFDGADRDVAVARAHYEHVGRMFDLDPFSMHSWHAGIHPACSFDKPAATGFERWSGSAFGNPRLLHFHTCGDYAPGEISLNVLDPTIAIDGIPVWNTGRFDPNLVPGGADILAEHPDLSAVFAHPARAVGQGPQGRLCGRQRQA